MRSEGYGTLSQRGVTTMSKRDYVFNGRQCSVEQHERSKEWGGWFKDNTGYGFLGRTKKEVLEMMRDHSRRYPSIGDLPDDKYHG